MTATLLACGHSASAAVADGDPACPICVGLDPGATVAAPPDLTGRMARCYCDREPVPSSLELAFFEFRGEGSRAATDSCAHCGYAKVAHERKQATGEAHLTKVCDNFEPRGAWEYDAYYCGCRGWD